MAFWKDSRYLSVDDEINALDPKTSELRTVVGVRMVKIKDISDNFVHVVKPNDTLFTLAVQYYGDARYWWIIADVNATSISNPYDIGDVQQLLIPNVEDYVQ